MSRMTTMTVKGSRWIIRADDMGIDLFVLVGRGLWRLITLVSMSMLGLFA